MVKKIWWEARGEIRHLGLWILAKLPLGVGIRLRMLLMPLFLQSVGKNTVFRPGFVITNPESVSIGSNCVFDRGMFITGGGGVHIGDWVGFGPDVKVWSVNHRYDDPNRPWRLQGWHRKAVEIEDDVWLGANVFVMPGVKIGRGAIVSAASVVAKSVPPMALVAGNPGRIVGWRKHPADVPPAQGEGRQASRIDEQDVRDATEGEDHPKVGCSSSPVELHERIRGFILKNFLFSQDAFALGPNDSLSGRGIVDSAGVLELVLFIEEELGVRIRQEELVRDNLDTINKIAAFVELKRPAA